MRQAERSYVAEPLDLVDDGIGVWKVHTVIHGQWSGLSDHPVDLGLNLLCASREDMECDNMCMAFKLNCTFLKELLCSTLDLGVFGHVEESPAQRGGRGLRARHKQIHHTKNQVFLFKSTFGLALILSTSRHDAFNKYQQRQCCKSV